MSRIFWERGGFTVTELLVAMLFAGIVVATLYGFFRDQLFTLISQETKTATLEDARGGLNLMAREIRNAGAWANGSAPAGCSRFVTATATAIQVQADVDGNGNCADAANGEDVTYQLSAGTSTCPGSRITRREPGQNEDCLVANVVTLDTVTPPGPPLFTYFNSSNVSFVPTSSSLINIKRVQITFRVQVINSNPKVGGNIFSTLSTSVLLRNE